MIEQEQRPDSLYEPRKAHWNPKFMKSKIEIVSSDEYGKVVDRTNRFVDFVKSYGAQLRGFLYSTTANTIDGVPFVTHSITICYEIAETVTPAIMARAYEK